MSRLRAVEHGRAVLVAATSGISAVVAPDGRVEARRRSGSRGPWSPTVPLRDGGPLATRLGAWPEWLLAAVGLVRARSLRRAGAATGGGDRRRRPMEQP